MLRSPSRSARRQTASTSARAAGPGAVSLAAGAFGVAGTASLALLPETPGRASAAFYVAFDLGIGLGSWLFGVALQLGGLPRLYWTAAALAAGVLPLTLLLSSPRGDQLAHH